MHVINGFRARSYMKCNNIKSELSFTHQYFVVREKDWYQISYISISNVYLFINIFNKIVFLRCPFSMRCCLFYIKTRATTIHNKYYEMQKVEMYLKFAVLIYIAIHYKRAYTFGISEMYSIQMNVLTQLLRILFTFKRKWHEVELKVIK